MVMGFVPPLRGDVPESIKRRGTLVQLKMIKSAALGISDCGLRMADYRLGYSNRQSAIRNRQLPLATRAALC
jgi:hypothetical protein